MAATLACGRRQESSPPVPERRSGQALTRAEMSEPPDEVLEPGPTQTLALAPPTEVLEPDPELNGRLAAAAIKRVEERRLETFSHEASQVALRGTVTAAEGQVFTTKGDEPLIATRYLLRRQQSWKMEIPEEVEIWALGGQAPATKGSDGPPREESYSHEVYFKVGQEVLLSLREAPLFPGDKPRLRVLRGSSGALVSGADGETKALDLFAAALDQSWKRY